MSSTRRRRRSRDAREALQETFRDFLSIPGLSQYLVRRSDVVAGGGSMRLSDGVAQLCGAATLPDHRRQGVQSAALRARLLDAAEHGADVAVVTHAAGIEIAGERAARGLRVVMRARFW